MQNWTVVCGQCRECIQERTFDAAKALVIASGRLGTGLPCIVGTHAGRAGGRAVAALEMCHWALAALKLCCNCEDEEHVVDEALHSGRCQPVMALVVVEWPSKAPWYL